MKKDLQKVAIRNNALYIENAHEITSAKQTLNETTTTLIVNCVKLGFSFSEELLRKVNVLSAPEKLELFELLKEISGVNKNWTPLVKQWDIPTNETILDHVFTWFANAFQSNRGTRLSCGHLIPNNTFPLERYNGCPFCGTPFVFSELDYEPRQNKLRVLNLWTEKDLQNYFVSLLESPVALDATQSQNLITLLNYFAVPEGVEIKMKETVITVIDAFVIQNKLKEGGSYFTTPADILRYLWYKHTGFLQIVEPKIIIKRKQSNAANIHFQLDKNKEVKFQTIKELKLKFSRKECKMYAIWLNNLTISVEKQCEIMHSKRGIWVRIIRALRLAEYSKREGFEKLAQLLDVFYNEKYEVWQGKVNQSRLKSDADTAFELLKERPGLFARSLFSTMLRFGPETTITHFKEIIDKVPTRLIFTLNMYAENYFDKKAIRSVKPLGGTSKRIPANKMLQLYRDEDLLKMQALINDLTLESLRLNFSKVKTEAKTIFIEEQLFSIPLAIGDRCEHLQDLPEALPGTKFKVQGDTIRLFLQWGVGLPAQHLDMDLSSVIIYENRTDICSYSQLVTTGCKHSGDIQRIQDKIGAAEYIDLNLNELTEAGAKYVSFACNAYTMGSISPNAVVGWMNSEFEMKIAKSGVAFNPTDVQHQIRIKKSLSKGWVFGVLDVQSREITWLEMSFGGQIAQNIDASTLDALFRKLNAKLKIGAILQLKAEVQGLKIVDIAELADEVYDASWFLDLGNVNQLLFSSK
jgi:hypothetical protein